MDKKKAVRAISQVEEEQEKSKYSEIAGFDGDMVENGRPFGKEGCRCGPSVLESTAPFLVWHLAWECWKDVAWMPKGYLSCDPHWFWALFAAGVLFPD